MAKRTPKPIDGETRFGPNVDTVATGQGVLYIESGGPSTRAGMASKGTVFAFDARDTAGAVTTVYIWCSTDGKLRIGTTFPTDTESGTVVGSQS